MRKENKRKKKKKREGKGWKKKGKKEKKENSPKEILVMAQNQSVRTIKVRSCLILSPTWGLMPLDKAGFGTSRQLQSYTWVTENYSVINCVLGPSVPIVIKGFFPKNLVLYMSISKLATSVPFTLEWGGGVGLQLACQECCPNPTLPMGVCSDCECLSILSTTVEKRLWNMLTQHILR